MTEQMIDDKTGKVVDVAEQHRAKRMANAKEKKGRNIVLLKKLDKNADMEALKVALARGRVFIQGASENEELRETPDVFQWMEDNAVLGTVYGVRFSRYDKDNARRGYTRQEQTTIKNV